MIPNLMDDFEGFKTSVEEVTADVVEIARELGLELEPKDVIELLKSHDKILMTEELLLWMSKERGFLNLLLDEVAVKTAEMTRKDL